MKNITLQELVVIAWRAQGRDFDELTEEQKRTLLYQSQLIVNDQDSSLDESYTETLKKLAPALPPLQTNNKVLVWNGDLHLNQDSSWVPSYFSFLQKNQVFRYENKPEYFFTMSDAYIDYISSEEPDYRVDVQIVEVESISAVDPFDLDKGFEVRWRPVQLQATQIPTVDSTVEQAPEAESVVEVPKEESVVEVEPKSVPKKKSSRSRKSK